MVDIDLEFPHSYEIEEIPELPGTGEFNVPVHYFPRSISRPEHDGIWLCIRPMTGQSWIGVFDFGYRSPPAISRVVSTPNDDCVCIISRGAAYIVNAEEPNQWELLDIRPVLDLRLIPEYQLLVFADFTRLIAYGNHQIVWKSPRLCWDYLKILNVSREEIIGVGYDPTNSESESRFAVDIRTGKSLCPAPVSIDGKSVWR
ncbi:MAG: hypothetical protein ABSC48_06275 [Terracidiphilus sp.]